MAAKQLSKSELAEIMNVNGAKLNQMSDAADQFRLIAGFPSLLWGKEGRGTSKQSQ